MHYLRHTILTILSVALVWILAADMALAHGGEDHATVAGISIEHDVLNLAGVVLMLVGAFWLRARGSSTGNAADFEALNSETDAVLHERDTPKN